MKKNIFLTFFVLISIFGFSQNNELFAYKIYNSEGQEVMYSEVVKGIIDADMVFLGELHNNPISHWMELNLVKSLFDVKKENLVLGAEMFESDNQLILDEYLNDIISEKNFESECRLWPNYKTDYKPIINYAKVNKIPFVATNIPRRYANVIFKKDFEGLDNLNKNAKKYIAPLPITFDATVECYKKMIDGMAGMGNHGSETIAKAQAAKDATMAYFIMKNFKKGNLFFHFNGSFHSDNYQGICWYLKLADKKIKIKTITTVTQSDITKLEEENKSLADYIICVPDDMTTTY